MSVHARYTIRRKIADGGTAEIFLATQRGAQGFEKPVVLKRIFAAFYADPQFRNMLIDEAHIAMSLSHSNIVQVLDLGEADGQYVMALELVDGWTLDAVLRRANAANLPIPPALALYITAEICRALAYAHAKTGPGGKPLGIVHRDISPHNVLLSEQGEVKLTDFGIAKAQNRRDQSVGNLIKGKIAYMSPEQAAGAILDARSDLFSVGTLLYVMICRRFPFDAATDYELLLLVKTGEYLPPESARPGLNPDIYRVIRRAMARKQDERYQRAEDMLVDVEQVMRLGFRAVGQTELKRWLVELSARDGVPPLTRTPAVESASPAGRADGETLELKGVRTGAAAPPPGRPRGSATGLRPPPPPAALFVGKRPPPVPPIPGLAPGARAGGQGPGALPTGGESKEPTEELMLTPTPIPFIAPAAVAAADAVSDETVPTVIDATTPSLRPPTMAAGDATTPSLPLPEAVADARGAAAAAGIKDAKAETKAAAKAAATGTAAAPATAGADPAAIPWHRPVPFGERLRTPAGRKILIFGGTGVVVVVLLLLWLRGAGSGPAATRAIEPAAGSAATPASPGAAPAPTTPVAPAAAAPIAEAAAPLAVTADAGAGPTAVSAAPPAPAADAAATGAAKAVAAAAQADAAAAAPADAAVAVAAAEPGPPDPRAAAPADSDHQSDPQEPQESDASKSKHSKRPKRHGKNADEAAVAAGSGGGESTAGGDAKEEPKAATDGEDDGAAAHNQKPRVSVMLKSTPPGARVGTAHHPFGSTPISVRFRPGGTYSLTFSHDGYQKVTRRVRVTEDSGQEVEVSLPRAGGGKSTSKTTPRATEKAPAAPPPEPAPDKKAPQKKWWQLGR